MSCTKSAEEPRPDERTQEGGEDGVVSRFVPVEELFAGRHFDAEIVVLCVRWRERCRSRSGCGRVSEVRV